MYLLLDIGGTHTRLAVSKDLNSFDQPEIFATPDRLDAALNLIRDKAYSLSPDGFTCIALGVPGILNREKNTILKITNLPLWENANLVDSFTNIFNAPVFLENDSALVGLGEANFGAGKGYDIVSYITISTGIGGVRITDGKIDKSAFGFEPGHQILDIDETVLKGTKPKIQGLADIEDNVTRLYVLNEYSQNNLLFEDSEKRKMYINLMAVMLNNTIVHWSPDVLILGGGVANLANFPLNEIKQKLDDVLNVFPQKPDIKLAKLGDVGGLWGAMQFIKITS